MARLGRSQPFAPIIGKALPPASITGDLSATLGALTLASAGAIAIAGSFAVTLGAVTLASAGAIAIAGAAAITLGQVTLSSNNSAATVYQNLMLFFGIEI